MGDVNCSVPLNPDISGVGVRVALYMQSLIGNFMGIFQPTLIFEIGILAYLTGISLFVAALSQSKVGSMSLLDAVILDDVSITPLILFAEQSLILWVFKDSEDTDEHTLRRCLTRIASMILGLAYFLIWCVWNSTVYPYPSNFGPKVTDTGCSPNENVIVWTFGITRRIASKEYERLFRISTSVAMFFVALMTGAKERLNQESSSADDRQPISLMSILARIKAAVAPSQRRDQVIVLLRVAFTLLFVLQILLIWLNEKTITANNIQTDNSTWSFGQITALLAAILQSITTLCQWEVTARLMNNVMGRIGMVAQPPSASSGGSIRGGYVEKQEQILDMDKQYGSMRAEEAAV
ncbi:unnamed protein product [Rhizoctonia solani]|uniref:Uncharacterized protein n=1 Tax=Rhizoctonia solani TaxID=456999 RepID=A0A8H2XKC3_9AGAM|nr:unnamed protein product [Rhizoctonia solani]